MFSFVKTAVSVPNRVTTTATYAAEPASSKYNYCVLKDETIETGGNDSHTIDYKVCKRFIGFSTSEDTYVCTSLADGSFMDSSSGGFALKPQFANKCYQKPTEWN